MKSKSQMFFVDNQKIIKSHKSKKLLINYAKLIFLFILKVILNFNLTE